MTRDRRSAVRLLATCAVAAVALTGCGSSPLRAGAAAVVGDSRISTEQLATIVDTGLANPAATQLAADRPSYQRDVLSRLITADVIATAAQREGVTVTLGAVDAAYAAISTSVGGAEELTSQAAASGLSLAQVRDLARAQALSDALGDKLTAGIQVPAAQLQQAYQAAIDTYDQVHVAQIQLASLADAQALLPQVSGLSDADFSTVARARSLDAATKDAGGDVPFAGRSSFTDQGLTDYATAVFAARVGATLAVPGTNAGYVVRVLGRRTTTLEQATPQLRRTALQTQRESALQELLTRTAASLHITINPRFGAWDGAQLQVVAATALGASPAAAADPTGDREVSSPEAPAGGPATPGDDVLPSPAP